MQDSSSFAPRHRWSARFLDVLSLFIPAVLHNSADTLFRARTLVALILTLTSVSLASMCLLIWLEQNIPARRLVTLSLVLAQPLALVLMHLTQRITGASWMITVLSWLTVWYVDFNNLSFSGPMAPLWVLPTTISALLLDRNAVMTMTGLATMSAVFDYCMLNAGLLPEPISQISTDGRVNLLATVTTLIFLAFSLNSVMQLAKNRSQALIKEIALHEDTLNKLILARDAAEKSTRAKTEFLAQMSHELRTPLNAVLGNATLLQSKDLPEDCKSRVKDINQAGEILLSLINDILDLSKMESGKLQLHCRNFDLAELLTDLHRILLPNVHANVVFNVDALNHPYIVSGDSHRISQMVMNLISNAIKFTDQGEISLSLRRIESPSSGQMLTEISVRDTGSGISAEDQEKLFTDFVQVGSHHKHKLGSGLGLAITLRIAKQMEGRIELESAPGQGTCFRLLLPLTPVDLVSSNTSPERSDEELSQVLSKMRVLIVDDIAMNTFILSAMLQELGIRQITVAADGIEAIESVKNNRFDLIFMDIQMPRMSGIEAAGRIRTVGFQKPIIAVTANAFEEDRQASLQNGMNEFIAKPIDFELLKQTIKSFV